METKIKFAGITLPTLIVTLLTLGMLTGCGGGDSTPAANTLSGTAAVGFPIVGGTVSVTCAAGAAITNIPNTSNTGAWSVNVSGQTLPCAVQVTSGTINNVANTTPYHSIAMALGIVNVTPLTDLLIANLAGTATPNIWFDTYDTNSAAINETAVNTALTNLLTALGLTTQLTGIHPITSAFTATSDNVMDNTLEALQVAIAGAGVSGDYVALLNLAGATAGTSFATPAGFNAALATAYVPPPTGGGATGGTADIDVTNATPASGNTNISGVGAVVTTTFDTLNTIPVTRVTVAATTTDSIQRQVQVYFVTATGAVSAVSYSWGGSLPVHDNIVYCPATGCTGVTVNQVDKTIFFTNTVLDNNSPVAATTKFATLSLGGITYP